MFSYICSKRKDIEALQADPSAVRCLMDLFVLPGSQFPGWSSYESSHFVCVKSFYSCQDSLTLLPVFLWIPQCLIGLVSFCLRLSHSFVKALSPLALKALLCLDIWSYRAFRAS